MPLREALLAPIPGENPAGQDLRYTPLYDKLKEARREDEDLAQGEWKHERKLADHALVIKLCEEAIATQSKDLQLAVWLVEALLKKQGFAGFADGLQLCCDLLTAFWEHLYPAMEEGDLELRAAPLDLLGGRFDAPLKMTALNAAGHNWFQHRESRALGYDDASKDANARKAREKALKEGRLAPEEFDKSFEETPKAFYAGNEKALDAALAVARELGPLCEEKFGGQAPTFGRLQSSLEEVRHLVHQLLDKKREAEPDPVEPEPVEAIPEEASPSEAGTEAGPITFQFTASLDSATEPPDRREAIESIVSAAALLRRREPRSPAAYLMLRGLRWGELRAAAERGTTAMLESPPSEARRLIKRLHVEKRWRELLEAAEAMMAFPYSRAPGSICSARWCKPARLWGPTMPRSVRPSLQNCAR